MKKFFVLLALIMFMGLIGWQVYEKVTASAKKPTRRPKDIPVAVEIAQVQKITIRDVGLFTGTLKPRAQTLERISKWISLPSDSNSNAWSTSSL